MRVKMIVEYEGTAYAGWQRQENATTVQQMIEEAIYKATGEHTVIVGAGRTDAGVHAQGQVCHFDTDSTIPAEKFSYAVNMLLPKDIVIRRSSLAAPDFHSRYDAKAKWYRYLVHNDQHASAMYRNLCYHVPNALDDELMAQALEQVVGTHDFAAFASAGSSVKSTIRKIYAARLQRTGDRVILDLIGNGFLYNMVRILAGTLLDIGKGRLPANTFTTMLQTKNRESGGITAPAHGLTLMAVYYQETNFEKYLTLPVGEYSKINPFTA